MRPCPCRPWTSSIPGVRHLLTVVGILTFINVSILGTAGMKGVEVHGLQPVLRPHLPYADEPRIHRLPGLAPLPRGLRPVPHRPRRPAFVRAKIAGVRQVFAVAFSTYSRPIPSPVENLRPARETCEQCHWPQKFSGNKLIVRTKYAEDEANTPSTSVLLLKIGGHTANGTTGIHGRHLDTMARITYVATDRRRQEIPKVTYRDDQGQLVEFVTRRLQDPAKEKLDKAATRQMDCVDCHNRPTHAFQMPDRAIDKAIANGRMSRELPFLKKKAVEMLKVDYPDQKTPPPRSPWNWRSTTSTTYPEIFQQKRGQVDTAGEVVKTIYLHNVFPEMKLTWGTHPNNIGHEDSVGCFRCHDGSHTSADGRTIKGDCDTCHILLAQDEKDPKILKELGHQVIDRREPAPERRDDRLRLSSDRHRRPVGRGEVHHSPAGRRASWLAVPSIPAPCTGLRPWPFCGRGSPWKTARPGAPTGRPGSQPGRRADVPGGRGCQRGHPQPGDHSPGHARERRRPGARGAGGPAAPHRL